MPEIDGGGGSGRGYMVDPEKLLEAAAYCLLGAENMPAVYESFRDAVGQVCESAPVTCDGFRDRWSEEFEIFGGLLVGTVEALLGCVETYCLTDAELAAAIGGTLTGGGGHALADIETPE